MLNIPIAARLEEMDRDLFFKWILPDLSDSSFLDLLSSHRGRGRNDYPLQLLWHGLLASVAYKVSSMEEMRRKMGEQPDLFPKIPSSYSFSRFFSFLCRFSSEIEALLVRRAEQMQPSFGQLIALGEIDGMLFLWEPQFGLPLFFQEVREGEEPVLAAQKLIERTQKNYPQFFRRCKYLLAASSFEGLIPITWDHFKLRAIIPRQALSNEFRSFHGAYYDEQGMVYCDIENRRAMICTGFEESRNTLKYRCLVRHYGSKCDRFDGCPLRSGIRIPLTLDPKLFTPVPYTSYRWGKLFGLYSSIDSVKNMLHSYLRLANQNSKKILCCQIASLLLMTAAKRMEGKPVNKSRSTPNLHF